MLKFSRTVHPGELLREEFLSPYNMSADDLAAAVHADSLYVNRFVAEGERLTPEFAWRLARYFQTSVGFWTNMQMDFDNETFNQAVKDCRPALTAELNKIEPHKKR